MDEQRGGARADDPEAEAPRFLHLRVGRVLAGAAEPGDTLVITSNEPYLRDADGEIVVATGPDCFTLVTGDEAVVALVGDGTDPSTSALLTPTRRSWSTATRRTHPRRRTPGSIRPGEPLADLEAAVEDALR